MGQQVSRTGVPSRGDCYGAPIYATSLSHDRQTEVCISGDSDTVQIGPRAQLPYLDLAGTRRHDLFRQLGLVVKTRGNRITQNAEVLITDFYRLDGKRFVSRDHDQGPKLTDWRGLKGPAEASCGLRVGDTLYAINHRLVVNKSKRQVLRQINSLLEKGDGAAVVLTWKHTDEIEAVCWENELCMPPPEGVYTQLENEWGPARPSKISSVSI
uniref:PDZ domain-containing protein n=1 Tax=Hyaloperonospora arabidopsidis (strain Emoy2) TaxID=559515 RepID=M4BQ54_HYAAE